MKIGFVDIATQCLKLWFILSFLFLSRGTTCCNWRKHSTWNKKEGSGWHTKTVNRGEMLDCCRDVRIWTVETLQDWCVDRETLERIILIQASVASGSVIRKIRSSVLFGYVEPDIKVPEDLREVYANFPPFFKSAGICTRNWTFNAVLYWERSGYVPTATNLVSSLELTNGTINIPLLIFYFELRLVWTNVYRFVEYTAVKSFNNFCALRCQCFSSKRRESQLESRWRNYEVAWKQHALLLVYGSQWLFSYKVNDWWKDTHSDQQ